MLSNRQLFLNHLAQTSDSPLSLEIEKAEACYLFDKDNKKFLDLISGISVSNLGHCNKQVANAAKNQLDKFNFLMVYGEYILNPQVKLASRLAEILPDNLSCSYFVNSGSEAVEGAIKLAKRYSGRHKIISFKNAYHGSTHGALSLMGNEYFKQSFRPLLPGISFLEFNNESDIDFIDESIACVIIEPIQAEAGVIIPDKKYLQKLRAKCDEKGVLLIFDEIQTGLGRTGTLFAFEKFNIVPDILLLAKAFGGGFPLGAFISSKEIMHCLTNNPALGHISTFGGHPVSCAAALENLNIIIATEIYKTAESKGNLFKKLLKHKEIISINQSGLLISVELENNCKVQKSINFCIQKGIIIDWFLFANNKLRIAPPLIITESQINDACKIIINSLNSF